MSFSCFILDLVFILRRYCTVYTYFFEKPTEKIFRKVLEHTYIRTGKKIEKFFKTGSKQVPTCLQRLVPLTWLLLPLILLSFLLAGWVTIQERRKSPELWVPGFISLGGKNLGWFVIRASFASNIGSEHLNWTSRFRRERRYACCSV